MDHGGIVIFSLARISVVIVFDDFNRSIVAALKSADWSN
jgi:hypothetical protein